MECEIIRNVDVPSGYVGLRILLVDPDTTSLSNIAAILEEHSFKASPKNVLERMCVHDLTKECLTYRLKVSKNIGPKNDKLRMLNQLLKRTSTRNIIPMC
ncbi:hypothetical protein KY285_000801 [Solanum tuberosum]|nr:hypothetical protein KY285_000801 [Solanum tuberosum]